MSIIGGLIVSQVLTLYTTPVIYLALDRINRKIEAAVPPDESGSHRRRLREPRRACSDDANIG
jgi:hypothetical protein